MSNVIRLHRDAAFGPEAVEVMCQAYDGVIAALPRSHNIQNVEEFVARWIIWLAQQGVRDVRGLRERTLRQLSQKSIEQNVKLHREFLRKVLVSVNGIFPRLAASSQKISESVQLLGQIDKQLGLGTWQRPTQSRQA